MPFGRVWVSIAQHGKLGELFCRGKSHGQMGEEDRHEELVGQETWLCLELSRNNWHMGLSKRVHTGKQLNASRAGRPDESVRSIAVGFCEVQKQLNGSVEWNIES
eukprot:1161672-Amphidinium_carterae.1